MTLSHQVGPDTVVHFSYRLRDAEGELAEQSEEALSFLFGYGQVAPALERALDGLRAGDARSVIIEPQQAFGPRRDEAILELDRAEFGPDLGVGDEFLVEHEEGDVLSMVVLEIDGDTVVVDTNHPLAGQAVTLEVLVEAVRPATSAEIALAVEELEAKESAFPSLLPGSRLVRRPPEQA